MLCPLYTLGREKQPLLGIFFGKCRKINDRLHKQLALLNSKFKMQNSKLRCRLWRLFKIICVSKYHNFQFYIFHFQLL